MRMYTHLQKDRSPSAGFLIGGHPAQPARQAVPGSTAELSPANKRRALTGLAADNKAQARAILTWAVHYIENAGTTG